MRSLNKRRIALIGGAGFIGHNMALALNKLGAEVQVIDSLQVNNLLSFFSTTKEIQNRELYLKIIRQRLDLLHQAGIPVVVQDARDYYALTRALVNFNPQVIIHLAAVAHANLANKDPYSTFDHSLRTLENSLDIARSPELNIEHFIYFSSSMVYGNFTSDFVTEDTPCEPLGIYGALKFSGEKIVLAYNQVFNLPYTIIRPSALYGERCVSRRVGQIFIENAIRGMDVSVKGDGSARLDFTYIDDLTQGIIKVLENKNAINQTFNLTYGQSKSIGEMASILTQHFPKVKVTYLPKDKLTPDRGTLNVDKAKKMIGYAPQYPLEKGFVKYINWYQSIFNNFL
jgi:nucleoside-diphosphate-sugar epimerase